MKKLFLIFALFLAGIAVQAQLLHLTVANPTYDSVQDNVDTYFYVNGVSGTTNSTVGPCRVKASSAITQYCLKELVVGAKHGQVQGSGDSVHYQIQASLDNTNWFYLSEIPDQYAGTGTHALTTPTGIWSGLGIAADVKDYALYNFTDGQYCFPYYRIFVNNDATGHKFISAYVVLKKL